MSRVRFDGEALCLIVPCNQIILDPKQLTEGPNGLGLRDCVEVQSLKRGNDGIGYEAHQCIHLYQWDFELRTTSFRRVNCPNGVEVGDELWVEIARDQAH